jgi:tetratricopeptide (TPR) repeat protein
MKILLFNLGSVKDRIINWEIEGFRSLFEQDVILWGPIPDKKFFFENKEIPILSLSGQTSISDVFKSLPENWFPDIVTCDTSVLCYIPDMYLCPAPTILFTRDSWSDTLYNRKLVEFFDFLNHAVIDRDVFENFHVNLLPTSNCAISYPLDGKVKEDFEKREIDVIAIANYGRDFYHERYRNFYKLAESNKTDFKVRFFKGIERHEISGYYQRSKIMIDWAHTISNRSYEAALNGCLLFSHDRNTLIKKFWKPWEDYVPYNETNVLELLSYYLKNPDKSKAIIANARQKIKGIPPSWGQYVWQNIVNAQKSGIGIAERLKYNKSVSFAEVNFRSATPLLYNYDYRTNLPHDWKELYFNRINASLKASPDSEFSIKPLIEAARAAFLLKKYDLAEKYLDNLEMIFPAYAWIYYLKARIKFDHKDYTSALKLCEEALKCGVGYPDLPEKYVLPLIEKGNTCDSRRITDYMWQPVSKCNTETQTKSLLHLAYDLEGNIYRKTQDIPNAIEAYSKALDHQPVPDCIYKLCLLLISTRNYSRMLEITKKGLSDSPYDSIIILYHAYALINLKKSFKAFRVLVVHEKALRSFRGVRKIYLLRIIISLMLPLIVLRFHPVCGIITRLAVSLKSKQGSLPLE